MIIPNGTIEFIHSCPGSLDEDGYPSTSCQCYGPAVPCQYTANVRNSIGKTNGETFVKASYAILVEWLNFKHDDQTGRIRLRSRSGNTVGEYSVLDIEPLDAVCQLRILV